MAERSTRAALVLITVGLLSPACSKSGPSYAGAYFAQTTSGTVLVLSERTFETDWGVGTSSNDALSTVDVAMGTHGQQIDVGNNVHCIPATIGRIWCSSTVSDTEVAHEARSLDGMFTVAASDETIAEQSGGSLTYDDMVAYPSLTLRASDHALLIDKEDTSGTHVEYAIDPRTFATSVVSTLLYSSDEIDASFPSTAVGTTYARLGTYEYRIDNIAQSSALERAIPPSDNSSEQWETLNAGTTYSRGFILRADAYDPAAGPLTNTAQDSLFIVEYGSSTGVGATITKVPTADGTQSWNHLEPEGYLEAAGIGTDTLVLVVRTTEYAETCPSTGSCTATNDIIHAHVVGLSLASGAVSWRLDI